MNFDLITGLPSWYLLLCILAGILVSVLLYFREAKSEIPAALRRILGVIRFVSFTLIAILLLSPLLKIVSRNIEKPIIVIAQDNSQSLVLGEDSAYYRNTYPAELNKMVDRLRDDYDVRLFTYGDKVRPVETENYSALNFDEKETDISSIFDMMDIRFTNWNTGALVIAGDGIYNKGINPVYQQTVFHAPVYTIALGDTSTHRDAYLKRVLYNRIAFHGNDFPVEVIVNASKLSGATLTLKLSEGGAVLATEQLAVEGNNFSKTVRLIVNAGDPGMHHYLLSVSSNMEESTPENNRYDLFIDVLQSKQRILILSQSPHPDISALKEAIVSNINYEVDDRMISEFTGPVEVYSLVILHQLPSDMPESIRLADRLKRTGVPLLYIIGPQTNVNILNGQNTGLLLTASRQAGMNEALASLNEGFTLFTLSDQVADMVPFLPPLNTHFGKYEVTGSGGILFYQKIGSIETTNPLWFTGVANDTRVGVICGTGLWKWRMKSWVETGSHSSFNELVNKTVQYLAVKEDRRRFRISCAENIPENTAVEMKAELYNESYEPVNTPDVDLKISDDRGKTFEFTFSKADNAYVLNAGNFPVGTYRYSGTTHLGEDVLTDEGGFIISPVYAEQANLRAAHELLEALARENDGRMIDPGSLDSLPDLLEARGDIKSLIHAEKKYVEFIDIWWILVVVMALMAIEWFIRKWSGSY